MKISKSVAIATLVAGIPVAGNSMSISTKEFSAGAGLAYTYDAGVLSLFGHAPSEIDVLKAENEAHAVDGVIEVRNFATYSD